MYRIIHRDGTYHDGQPPTRAQWRQGSRSPIWAVVDLEIVDGGDAYQELLRTLEVSE